MYLAKKGYDNAREFFTKKYDLVLTDAEIDQVLNNQFEDDDDVYSRQWMIREFNEGYHDDTSPRDIWANAVVKELIGMEWPLNMDSTTYRNAFVEKLARFINKHEDTRHA